MKVLKILTLGLALLAVGCSKDGNAPVGQETVATQTTKLDVSIEVELDEEELRNAMIVKPKTTPGWKLVLPTLTNGDTIPLKLAFSNGASLDHHEKMFTYSDGKFYYKGEIAVTGYAASAQVTNSQWYVMAFMGGAREANTYAYAPQVQPLSFIDQFTIGGDLNLPFVSGWTPVERSNLDNNKGSFSVKLKPLGHFMRVVVENQRDHELAVYGFEVVSDKYWSSIAFQLPYDLASLRSGAMPNVTPYRGVTNRILHVGGNTLTKGGSASGTTSRTFGIWVMPKEPITTEETIQLNVIHRYHGGNWKFPFKVTIPASTSGLGGTQGLKTLKVKNDHKIYRPIHTIDRVALGNLNASGTELSPTATGALYVLERTNNAANRALPVYSNPRPSTEKLMTVTNWENVLPRSNPATNTHNAYNGRNANADGPSLFGTGGTLSHNGDTFQFAGNITYALRTVDGHRAAFRYTITPSTGTLRVDMVHLGTTWEVKPINQIATDSYWQLADRFGEMVTRTFAGSGSRITQYLGVYDKGLTDARADGKLGGTIWNTEDGVYRIGIGIDEGGPNLLQGHRFGRQVRQIHNKPLDIPAK